MLAIAAVSLAASSSSCVLTGDLPNLALGVPQRYKAAELLDPDGATPTLDWWRGFRWNELTQLMEEAQKCQNRTWRTRESWPAKLTDFPGFAGGCGVMPRSPLSE